MPLRKKLIVVGDRLLVRPEHGEEKTNTGLYLPATAVSSRMAQGGWVVSVGPGIPLPDLMGVEPEAWEDAAPRARYMPLQAQEGDYVLFIRKAAVEITFEGKQYLIVPNGSVLVLVREDWEDGESVEG
jgi:co-chaperonin GroES (HSP10)